MSLGRRGTLLLTEIPTFPYGLLSNRFIHLSYLAGPWPFESCFACSSEIQRRSLSTFCHRGTVSLSVSVSVSVSLSLSLSHTHTHTHTHTRILIIQPHFIQQTFFPSETWRHNSDLYSCYSYSCDLNPCYLICVSQFPLN